ncbi:hypothetical protein ETAF_2766 [Edwardsiella tarda FL6-60]|uniref:Mobile element protein n=1 Tax=Edwardsiella tarda (strain FL6-60) TaxID=718251 RepID=A0A0H3DW41_EDWTF|nr:hypothetical protein ETAF_2766 [Edwardsiella tarda FL6-60]
MTKQKRKITYWYHDNKALIDRGSIAFWLDDKITQSVWSAPHHSGDLCAILTLPPQLL